MWWNGIDTVFTVMSLTTAAWFKKYTWILKAIQASCTDGILSSNSPPSQPISAKTPSNTKLKPYYSSLDFTMICKYCNKEMRRHGDPGWHHCQTCNYNNRYNTSDPTLTIQEEIYVRTYNDHEYHLFIDYGMNKCRLYEYRTHSNKVNQDLLVIDHMIYVTPQTVENKIKTYLLFL
jgi:hypothetical protein